MTTALQVFAFGGKVVRTAGTPETPLFCASDVCEILTLGDVSCACERLDQDEVTLTEHAAAQNSHERVTAGPKRRAYKSLYVTESGLYSLIIGCEKPEAKAFKKWVTSEVLPAIRKYGYYSAVEADARKQTELLLTQCFPNLPNESAPIFRELIAALLVVRRERGAPGNPAWARSLASDVYGWAIKVDGQQQFRRVKNPNPKGSATDHSMFSDVAKEAVRRVVIAGTDYAKISFSWADWRSKMQVLFGGKALQTDLWQRPTLTLVGKK